MVGLAANGDTRATAALGSLGLDHGHTIQVLADGDLVLGGFFAQTVDFVPGAASAPLSVVVAWDVFIALLASVGTALGALAGRAGKRLGSAWCGASGGHNGGDARFRRAAAFASVSWVRRTGLAWMRAVTWCWPVSSGAPRTLIRVPKCAS